MYEFLEYRVDDVMTRNPVVVGRHTPLLEIERIFEAHDFNSLPVVDDEGRLLGVVTKLDVLRAFLFTPRSIIPPYDEIMKAPAERVITWEPITVFADEPLTRVLEKIVHRGCKSFPVVHGDRLVGIVSREDILRGLRRAAEGKHPESSDRAA